MGERLPTTSADLQRSLEALGCAGRIRELPGSTRTAADAASAIGCEVGAIASSLIFMADDEPLLVMTSGAHRVDTALIARHLGVREVRRATPDEVRAATGQAIGGVAPVGHPTPVRTLVDAALADHFELWAAGGTPRTVFPLTFGELTRITGGEVCPVAEAPGNDG